MGTPWGRLAFHGSNRLHTVCLLVHIPLDYQNDTVIARNLWWIKCLSALELLLNCIQVERWAQQVRRAVAKITSARAYKFKSVWIKVTGNDFKLVTVKWSDEISLFSIWNLYIIFMLELGLCMRSRYSKCLNIKKIALISTNIPG